MACKSLSKRIKTKWFYFTKDQVTRLEARVDEIFVLLLAANTPKRKTSKSKGEE